MSSVNVSASQLHGRNNRQQRGGGGGGGGIWSGSEGSNARWMTTGDFLLCIMWLCHHYLQYKSLGFSEALRKNERKCVLSVLLVATKSTSDNSLLSYWLMSLVVCSNRNMGDLF